MGLVLLRSHGEGGLLRTNLTAMGVSHRTGKVRDGKSRE
jgi:hypothetical protein